MTDGFPPGYCEKASRFRLSLSDAAWLAAEGGKSLEFWTGRRREAEAGLAKHAEKCPKCGGST